MKKIIFALIAFGLMIGTAHAGHPELVKVLSHNTIAFDTSSGVTQCIGQVPLHPSARCIAVIPIGDDVFCVSGVTTPVDSQHVIIEQNSEKLLVPDEYRKMKFIADGDAPGYLNIIQFSEWPVPY